jgi:hypothetical protein
VIAVALGLGLVGLACVAAALLPVPDARPALRWILLTLAVLFFVVGAALSFGWIKA